MSTENAVVITDTGNLPTWAGAAHCYSKAYRILENMAARGAVKVGIGKRGSSQVCYPSQEMVDLIDALNSGDEEEVKGLLLYTHIYY